MGCRKYVALVNQNKKMRNHWIDVGKTIAIFGVLLVHMGPDQPDAETVTNFFAVYSVPFFLMVSLYFFWRSLCAGGYQEYSSRNWMRLVRINRLLLPYLLWSVVYTAARLIKHLHTGSGFELDWVRAIFFGGTAVQLYFIPLLIFFQIMGGAIYFIVKAYGKRRFPILSICVLIVLFYLSESIRFSGILGFSGGAFEKAIVYLFASYLIFLIENGEHIKGWNQVKFAIGVLGVSYFALENMMGYTHKIFNAPMFSFFAAVFLFGLPNLRISPFIGRVLQASFGVYLVHHLIIEGAEVIFLRYGVALAPYSLASKLIFGVAIMTLSVIFVFSIRRISWCRRGFLGE